MSTIVIERLSSGTIKMDIDGNTRYFAGGMWDIDPTANDAAFYIRHSSGFSVAVKDADTVNAVAVDDNADEIAEDLATDIFFLASSGGGGGVALESYNNTAMAVAMQAYVYRDEDNNIVRVYEPLNNNDISRNALAYADSIDAFPFDSEDCVNNILKDVKLIDVGDDIIIEGCNLQSVVINGKGSIKYTISSADFITSKFVVAGDKTSIFVDGASVTVSNSTGNDGVYTIASATFDTDHTDILVEEEVPDGTDDGKIFPTLATPHTGLQFINWSHSGSLGSGAPNLAEYYIGGNNVVFMGCTLEGGGRAADSPSPAATTFFDTPGTDSLFIPASMGVTFNGNFNGHKCTLFDTEMEAFITITLGGIGYFLDSRFGNSSYVTTTTDADIRFWELGIATNTDIAFATDMKGVKLGNYSNLTVVNKIEFTTIGVNSEVDTTDGFIIQSTIGDNVDYAPAADKTNVNIQNIGGTVYQLGHSGGNMTLTAV